VSADRSGDGNDALLRQDADLPPPPQTSGTEPPVSFTLEHKRARRVIGLLVATSIALVASIVVDAYQLGALARLVDDGFVTRSEADSIDAWVLATALVVAVLILFTGVAWLMWQHRAHVNVRNAAGGRSGSLSFTPAWGVGCWFVPFANLVLPYRAVAEIARESRPGSAPASHGSDRSTPAVIPAWWVAWILASIVGWVSAQVTIGSDPQDSLNLGRLELASDVVTLVAAGLAVGVVRLIDRRQTVLGRLMATGSLEEPAADRTAAETGPQTRVIIGSVVVVVTVMAGAIAYSAGRSAPGNAPVTNPSPSAATLEEGWILHQGEGFSVALPEAWRIRERPAVAELVAIDRATGTNILIYSEPLPATITLEQYAEATWATLSRRADAKRTAEDEIVELPAGSAIRISVETSSGRVTVRQAVHLLIHRSTGYGVVMTTARGRAEDDRTFEQIMDSFRFAV
jgi:hypothetical protein